MGRLHKPEIQIPHCDVGRGRKSLGDGEQVERWFMVTKLEAERQTADEKRAMRKTGREAKVAASKRPSRAVKQAEKKNHEEIMCCYTLGVILNDLQEEMEYAMIAGLFDNRRQEILRSMARKVTDARILSYRLTEPEKPPKPLPEPQTELVKALLVSEPQ